MMRTRGSLLIGRTLKTHIDYKDKDMTHLADNEDEGFTTHWENYQDSY